MPSAAGSSVPMSAPDPAPDPLARALLSLRGLHLGDSFGEQFLRIPAAAAEQHLRDRTPPPGPWPFTDDTLMALSVVDTLRVHGRVHPEHLATHFARLFDPARGYGSAMRGLLLRLRVAGAHVWQEEACALFNGTGSFGNGAAMRVAPLGAFFADDLARAAHEALRSARVTHTHPEAAAGAVAIAVAAALASQSREIASPPSASLFLETVRDFVSDGAVRDGIARAIDLGPGASPLRVAALLGAGARASAPDTVPFVLWSAARSLGFANIPARFEEALWQTVSAHGDTDTTCAMVGGIVILRTGPNSIPQDWADRAEPITAYLP